MRLLLYGLFFCCVSALVFGCAAPGQRLNRASGNPEIVIPNTSKKQVIDKIISAKLEKGMQVKSVTDYGVVVTKKVEGSAMASFMYGSRYDSTPEARITYNVVESGSSVRVFSRTEMVTNPGSGYERTSDVTKRVAAEMQSELEGWRAALAR
jgi:hypothetical protein